MSGFISISRDLVNHPLVGIQRPKYYIAWTWMLTQARWKPGRVMVGSNVIELQRGQLCHSLRFMADQLPLSIQEIRTFLKHLKNQHMVQHETNTGQTVITICNYDKYQREPDKINTAATQPPTQEQHSSNTKKNKDEIREGSVVVVDARAREDDPDEIHDRCCEQIGVSRETHMAFAASTHVHKWLNAGCATEDIFEGVRKGMSSLRGQPPNSMAYFDRPVMNAKATREQPLPEGRAQPPPQQSASETRLRAFLNATEDFIAETSHDPTRHDYQNDTEAGHSRNGFARDSLPIGAD